MTGRRPRRLILTSLLIAAIAGCQASGTASPAGPSAPADLPSEQSRPSASPPASAPQSGPHWEMAGSSPGLANVTHALTLSDGRVLAIGDNRRAQIFDPATSTWTPAASLNNPRTVFGAVALGDGRALVAGGENDIGQSYSSAYVYDPPADAWQKVGLMHTARAGPSAVRLPDGRVLVAGGYFRDLQAGQGGSTGSGTLASVQDGVADIVPEQTGTALATAEIFDPGTGVWSNTGSLNFARYGAAATLLADGRVLIVGSGPGATDGVVIDGRAFDTAEVYDPATGRFTLVGSLPPLDYSAFDSAALDLMPESAPEPAFIGTLVPLSDGGAVLVGLTGWWKHVGDVNRSLRFDPDGSWRETRAPDVWVSDPMTGESYESRGYGLFDTAVGILGDGRVIAAGGNQAWQQSSASHERVSIYDPDSDRWRDGPPMPEARSRGAVATLADGSVLLVGGISETRSRSEALDSALRLVP